MIDWEEDHHGVQLRQVQLTDIEHAVRVPPGNDIRDTPVGIWMWPSPEAHAQGRGNTPSDMFSFGTVVSRQANFNPLNPGMSAN